MHTTQQRPELILWAEEISQKNEALAGLRLPAVPLQADASTRVAFRMATGQGTVILMDAPPETENNGQFAALASWYATRAMNVPVIYAMDLDKGYFAVSDLGPTTYLQALEATPLLADDLYHAAMVTLLKLAAVSNDPQIPPYSLQRFQNELDLFSQWFATSWLKVQLPDCWQPLCQELLAAAVAQPKICVHRDFHSRNLMVLEHADNPGIVDYQDTLIGPLTYDIGSLLWDCYIDWPESVSLAYLEHFRQQLASQGMPVEPELFQRWTILTVSQRHLKALGIFARLYVQENRAGYLADIPRVLGYLERHLGVFNAEFCGWLAQLRPEIERHLASAAL